MGSKDSRTADPAKKFCDNEEKRDYAVGDEARAMGKQRDAKTTELKNKEQEIVHESEEMVKELYKEEPGFECFDKKIEEADNQINKEEKELNFKLPKETFTPGMIPEIKENIYHKPGVVKKKKESVFLSSSEQKMTENNEKQGISRPDAAKNCKVFKNSKLLYFEDGEMIEVGPGEVCLKEGNFVFVRELFKTIILGFPFENVEFKADDGSVSFREKGRKSEGETFKIVEREYLLEFATQEHCKDFMKSIKK